MSSLNSFLRLMDNSLVEKDLRSVMLKQGYPQWAAEWAHSVSPKYAFFVVKAIPKTFLRQTSELATSDREKAKALIDDFIADTTIGERAGRVIKNLFQNEEKPQLPKKPNDLTIEEGEQLIREWSYMKDWWRNPSVEGVVPQRLTWDQAKQLAHAWHEEIAKKAEQQDGGIELEDGQSIVVQFDDGGYWLDLNTDYCRDEADAMGHCGSASTGTLFSLRDKLGRPKITADIDVDGKVAGQIFGRGNTNPKQEYHRKILQLLGTLKIERVKPENHGHRSFAISDVDEEDLEWFEETFGYSLGGGASQAQIEAARKIIEDADGVEYSYLEWTDSEGSGADFEYYEVRQSIYWELSNLFEFHPRFDYAMSRNIETDEIKNNMSGDHVDVEWEIYDGSVVLRLDSSVGHFNATENSGSIEGDYQRYDNIEYWAKSIAQYAQSGDSRIGTRGFPALVRDLLDQGAISPTPLLQLFNEEDDIEVVPTRSGDQVKVAVHLGDIPIKKMGVGEGARIQNKLNKTDPLMALVRKPKGPKYVQPEFDFGESAYGRQDTSGRFFYKAMEINARDPLKGYGATKPIVNLSASILLDPDDEEGIKAAYHYASQPAEAIKVISAFLGREGVQARQLYGREISRGNKMNQNEAAPILRSTHVKGGVSRFLRLFT